MDSGDESSDAPVGVIPGGGSDGLHVSKKAVAQYSQYQRGKQQSPACANEGVNARPLWNLVDSKQSSSADVNSVATAPRINGSSTKSLAPTAPNGPNTIADRQSLRIIRND